MKNFVARAIQVSYLTTDQLKKVQELENKKLYIMPNWNIQQLLGIPGIKERYGLPHEDEFLASHNIRIESALKTKFKSYFMGQEFGGVDWTHEFDWTVHNQPGKMIWEYSGGGGNKGRLKTQIKESHLELIE